MTGAPAHAASESGVRAELTPFGDAVVVPPPLGERGRIGEGDALRGLAARAVVFYHYGQRYGELGAAFPGQFPMNGQPLLPAPWGRYGVHLFFMISGFVILMTITKIGRAS